MHNHTTIHTPKILNSLKLDQTRGPGGWQRGAAILNLFAVLLLPLGCNSSDAPSPKAKTREPAADATRATVERVGEREPRGWIALLVTVGHDSGPTRAGLHLTDA